MFATKHVIKASGANIEYDTHHVGELGGYDERLLERAIKSLEETKVCMKGWVLASRRMDAKHRMSMQMEMNHEIGTFVGVSHVHSYEGLTGKHQNVDFITIRETTEGEYKGMEHEAVPGVVESLKVTSKVSCERIAKFAFDYAVKHGRKKVTAIHKANIMKLGDGLFMKTCEEVSKLYPNIEYDDMIIDNTCMQLVSNPQQFDVMILPNLYGNIVENLGGGLIGGAGVLPGAQYAHDCAFFGAAARFTFLKGTGKDLANPTAMFMSAGNMLAHIGMIEEGKRIKSATRNAIKDGSVLTTDLGGYNSTTEFTTAVMEQMGKI